MTKITLKTLDEIVVHEVIKHELKELVKLRTTGLRTGQTAEALLWAEGVLFARYPMPPNDDIIREQLKGIVHFTSVEWTPMPKYRSTISYNGITIPILDVSETTALRDMARELKKAH